MSTERTRYNNLKKGLIKISIDEDEVREFISNSTGYSEFIGVNFETSRRSNAPGGAQNSGSKPVVVVNRESGKYIEISKIDFNNATRGLYPFPIRITEHNFIDSDEKTGSAYPLEDTPPKTTVPISGIEVGAVVNHKAFGKGIVTSADNSRLVVRFGAEEKHLKLPGAFSKDFLSLSESD
jgi:hypothetical protein